MGFWPGVVGYICNPNYLGGIAMRIAIRGQFWEKVRSYLKNT
jgi:hypothetical protein